MNQTLAVWILIVFSVAAANLPFLSDKVFGVLKTSNPAGKSGFLVCAELLVMYFVAGLLGFAFESALSNPFLLGWEFYAITLCIFLVLGFPGFVYRYLLK
ncbi:DUF2818 family protein [Orrella marina]|uniref:DUF2818 domain-containing protein n=1 Tax=Orrella marina TaxID=2163011 RepID=A0A2R4XPM9_9BURK|nr:DUF2818 family protein [Orrella marina]AWB35762.1 DUF2818 domain-containing protein [Orrella marina]